LAAYLSVYGWPTQQLNGGLVYPAGPNTPNVLDLQSKSPWRLTASERRLWFFGLACETVNRSGTELSEDEEVFIKEVQRALSVNQ